MELVCVCVCKKQTYLTQTVATIMAGASTDAEKQFKSDVLEKMKKAELVELVLQLKAEKEAIQEDRKHLGDLTNRIVELERSQFLYEQYGRREAIEITGIPTDIEVNKLEDEVIKVYNTANVQVFGRGLRKEDISACHRIGKKQETTIVRFINRKFAFAGLVNSKKPEGLEHLQ